jgi:hypothetical protein
MMGQGTQSGWTVFDVARVHNALFGSSLGPALWWTPVSQAFREYKVNHKKMKVKLKDMENRDSKTKRIAER